MPDLMWFWLLIGAAVLASMVWDRARDGARRAWHRYLRDLVRELHEDEGHRRKEGP